MQDKEQEFSFKSLFIPLTTLKSVNWIVAIGLIVYFNALFGQFLGGDVPQIVANPFVHSLNNIFLAFTDPITNGVAAYRFYRPIAYSVYTIIYSFFGLNTFFYHLLQISLHIASSSFVFLFLKRFFKIIPAFIFALIFLIHPMQTETVSFIASLQDVLYFFFGMIGFYFFVRLKVSDIKHTGFILLFLVLSLFSKETGILFPVLLMIYSFLFNKKHLKLSTGLFIMTIFLYGFTRFIIAKNFIGAGTQLTMSLLQVNVLSAPKMFFYYIATLLFPKDLSISQLWLVTSVSVQNFYMPLFIDSVFLVIIGFIGYFFWKTRRDIVKVYVFFLSWFTLGMVMCFPLWQLDATVADRWFYFPMVGLLGVAGLICNQLVIKRNTLRIVIFIVIFSIIILLAMRTITRNANYHSALALFTHDAPIVNNAKIYRLLTEELIRNGKFIDAQKQLLILSRLDSQSPLNLYYGGVIAENLGEYSKAEGYYRKFLQTDYGAVAYAQLSLFLISSKKDYTGSEKLLIEGINKYPNNAKLWELLAVSEYYLLKRKEAITAITKAKTLSNQDQNIEDIYNKILNNY